MWTNDQSKAWFSPQIGHALFFVCAILALGHLLVLGFQLDRSYDYPWHLALGQQLLETGSIPYVDRFSYTFQGEPFQSIPWLTEGAFALFHRFLGESGPSVLRCLCIVSSFVALFLLAVRRGVGRFEALALLLMAFTLIKGRLQLRPDIFHPPLLAATLWLIHLHETCPKGVVSRLALLGFSLVMILFANLHMPATPMLLCLVLAYTGWNVTATLAPHRFRSLVGPKLVGRETVYLVIAALICGGAIMLHPTSLSPIGWLQLNAETITSEIAEFTPVGLADAGWMVHLFISLTIVAFILGWSHRLVWKAIVTLALGLTALRFHRIIGPFALTTTPFVLEALTVAISRAKKKLRHRRQMWTALFSVWPFLILASTAWDSYGQKRLQDHLGASFDPAVYPVAAAEVLAHDLPKGHIFNDYNFGGYLMWRFRGELPVLIDGRTPMLYDEPFFVRVRAAVENPQLFNALVDEYGITCALFRLRGVGFPLARLPEWHVAYIDDVAVLYVRNIAKEQVLFEKYAARFIDPLRADLHLFMHHGPGLERAIIEADRLIALAPKANAPRQLRLFLMAAKGESGASVSGLTVMQRALVEATVMNVQGHPKQALDRLKGEKGALVSLVRAEALVALGQFKAALRSVSQISEIPEALLLRAKIANHRGEAAVAQRLHWQFVQVTVGDPLYSSRRELLMK